MKISFPPEVKITQGRKDYSNDCKFRLGESPYIFNHGCTKEKLEHVLKVLRDHHAKDKDQLKFDADFSFRKPGHAHTPGTNFHGIVEPLLSGATKNRNQKMAARMLFRNLTYADGKQSTHCPNYHKAFNLNNVEFGKIMRAAGKHNDNGRFLLEIMDRVRSKNIQLLQHAGNDPEKIHEEALNAEDWMPGLLNLDFLIDLDKQELFDELVSWPGIGPKIAGCIVSFTFNMPVYVVDTHNLRILKWLGLVPRGCTEIEAAQHVDSICPDELKSALHQALWHHGIRCYKCQGGEHAPDENTQKWKDTVCPLEQLGIIRFRPWKQSKKSKDPARKRQTKQTEQKAGKGTDTSTTDEGKMIELKTQEQRDCAIRLGYELVDVTEDDIWGLGQEKANTKAEIVYYAHFTNEQRKAFSLQFKANEGAKKPKTGTTTTTSTARGSRKKMAIEVEEEIVTQELVEEDDDAMEEDCEAVEEEEEEDEEDEEKMEEDEDMEDD